MEEWLNDYIEIELNTLNRVQDKPRTILEEILADGFVKTGLELRHFEVYERGNERLLYNKEEEVIDMIYNMKDVFGNYQSICFSSEKFREDKK